MSDETYSIYFDKNIRMNVVYEGDKEWMQSLSTTEHIRENNLRFIYSNALFYVAMILDLYHEDNV